LRQKLNCCTAICGFSKAFASIHPGKMREIILAYGIPSEIVSAIMFLYENTTAKVRSRDGDTDFF